MFYILERHTVMSAKCLYSDGIAVQPSHESSMRTERMCETRLNLNYGAND